jgi:hypothetical protein
MISKRLFELAGAYRGVDIDRNPIGSNRFADPCEYFYGALHGETVKDSSSGTVGLTIGRILPKRSDLTTVESKDFLMGKFFVTGCIPGIGVELDYNLARSDVQRMHCPWTPEPQCSVGSA